MKNSPKKSQKNFLFQKIILVVILNFFILTNINSQNLYNYNLFTQNPEIYNPSAIITNDIANFYFASRLQWAGFEGFPKYNGIGASFSIAPKMSLGISIFNSTHGIINNLRARASYAYAIKFNRNHFLKVGLSVGIVNDNLLRSQIQNVDNTDNVLQNGYYNKINFSSAFGLFYKLKGFETQIILPQLYEYNEFNIYGIGIIAYNFKVNHQFSVKPSILVRNTELNKIQGDAFINLYLEKNLWLQFGVRSNQSLVFGIGNQTIGYSYEAALNPISNQTIGTHEILLKFRIAKHRMCPAYSK